MSKDEAQQRPTVTGREDLREELRGGGLVQHVGEVALDATVTTAVVGVKVGYDKVKDVIAPKDKKK